jgi:hypothetical protein
MYFQCNTSLIFAMPKGHELAFFVSWPFFFGIWGISWEVGPVSMGFSEAAARRFPRGAFARASFLPLG